MSTPAGNKRIKQRQKINFRGFLNPALPFVLFMMHGICTNAQMSDSIRIPPPIIDTITQSIIIQELDSLPPHQPLPNMPFEMHMSLISENVNSLFTFDTLLLRPNKKRVWTAAGLHTGLYAGSMLVLNEAWYKDYPRGSFRTFNDWPEWLQIDKIGHTWSAYQLSRVSMASWRWAGLNHKQQTWLGGLSGFAFQTVIEILDGFSEDWGWSWGDFAANAVGSGMLIGQELGWGEQRINFKFSFHKMKYENNLLNLRSNELFGSSWPERMLKDYNGQTYWLSFNLKSFLPESNLPPWLNIATGYGGSGMLGGRTNIWTDEGSGTNFDLSNIPRQRQYYLAPDIDFTRIKTNNKWLRSLFFALNAFKMPAPALMISKGKLRFYGLYF